MSTIRIHDLRHEGKEGVAISFIEDDDENPFLEKVDTINLTVAEAEAVVGAIVAIIVSTRAVGDTDA